MDTEMRKVLEMIVKLSVVSDDGDESANCVYVFTKAILQGDQDAFRYAETLMSLPSPLVTVTNARGEILMRFCDDFEAKYLMDGPEARYSLASIDPSNI